MEPRRLGHVHPWSHQVESVLFQMVQERKEEVHLFGVRESHLRKTLIIFIVLEVVLWKS